MSVTTKRYIGAIIGLIAAILATVVVYLLFLGLMDLLDAGRVRFRMPLAFLFLPVLGIIGGWKMGPDLIDSGAFYWRSSVSFRAAILVPVVWAGLVLLGVVLFEPRPFHYGINDRNAIVLGKLIIFPPAVIAILFGTYFLIRGKK